MLLISYRRSPLQIALYLGKCDIARLLIGKGAALDHYDTLGNNIAHGIFVRGIYAHHISHETIYTLLKLLVSVDFSEFGQVNRIGASVLSLAVRGYALSALASVDLRRSQTSSAASSAVTPVTHPKLAALPRKFWNCIESNQQALLTDATDFLGKGGEVIRANLHDRIPELSKALIYACEAIAAKSKCSTINPDKFPRQNSSSASSHLTEYPGSNNLDHFAECIIILLQYEAEPWRTMRVPFLWCRILEWWRDQQGYLGHEERIRDYPAMVAIYCHTIQRLYPETSTDTEGNIFWDAKQKIEGPAYGCSYLSSS